MSTSIEQRIVEMKFDRKGFSEGVKETLKDLDTLDKGLQFKGGKEAISTLQNTINAVTFGKMLQGINTINESLNNMQSIGYRVFENLINRATDWVATMVRSLSVDQIGSGFSEYEAKMDSVRVIMSSTGESLETVNKYLEELNQYSDKTIYSFADMTSSIGKFTNAGVDLDKAVAAIKGISNEAARSGASAADASRAMYNFAQALSSGAVKLIDWKSIENANMATVEFKNELIKTALALGTVVEVEGQYQSTTTDTRGNVSELFTETMGFNDSLSSQWMTTDVLVETLRRYGDETTDIGAKSYEAAMEVTTFTKMMDALKESVQSGWSQTFEILFGDLEHAKKLWTFINDRVSAFIQRIADTRNGILEFWKAFDDGGAFVAFRQGLVNIYFMVRYVFKYIFLAFETLFGHRYLQNLEEVKSFFSDREGFKGNLVVINKIAKALISFSYKFREVVFSLFDLFTEGEDSASRLTANIYWTTQSILIPLRTIFKIVSGIVSITLPRAIRTAGMLAKTVIDFLGKIGYELTEGGKQEKLYAFAEKVVSTYSKIVSTIDWLISVVKPKVIEFAESALNKFRDAYDKISAFFEGVKPKVEGFFSSLKSENSISNFEKLSSQIEGKTQIISEKFDELKQKADETKNFFEGIGNKISILFGFDELSALSTAVYQLGLSSKNFGSTLSKTFKDIFSDSFVKNSERFSKYWNGLKNGEWLVNIFKSISEHVKNLRMTLEGVIFFASRGIIRGFTDQVYSLIPIITNATQNVREFGKNFKQYINDLAKSTAMENVINWLIRVVRVFVNLKNSIKNEVVPAFKKLSEYLGIKQLTLYEKVRLVLDGLSLPLKVITKTLGGLFNIFGKVIKMVVQVASYIPRLQLDILGNLLRNIWGHLAKLSGVFYRFSRDMFNENTVLGTFIFNLRRTKIWFDQMVHVLRENVIPTFKEFLNKIFDKSVFDGTTVVELLKFALDGIAWAIKGVIGIAFKFVDFLERVASGIGRITLEKLTGGLQFMQGVLADLNLRLRVFYGQLMSVKTSQYFIDSLRWMSMAIDKVKTSAKLLFGVVMNELVPALRDAFKFLFSNRIKGEVTIFKIFGLALDGVGTALKIVINLVRSLFSALGRVGVYLGKLAIDGLISLIYNLAKGLFNAIVAIKVFIAYIKYSEAFAAFTASIKRFKDALVDMGTSIRDFVVEVLDEFIGTTDVSHKILQRGSSFIEKVLMVVINGIIGAFKILLSIVKYLTPPIKAVFDALAPVTVDLLTKAFNGLAKICETVANVFKNLRSDVSEIFKSFKPTEEDVEKVTNAISRLSKQASRTFSTLKRFLSAGLKPISNWFSDFGTNLSNFIVQTSSAFSDFARKLGLDIIANFFERISKKFNEVTTHGKSVREVLKSMFAGIKPAIIEGFIKILDTLRGALRKVNNVIWDIWTGVTPIFASIGAKLSPIVKGVKEFFSSFFEGINIRESIKNALAPGMESDNPFEWILNGLKNTVNSMIDWLKETKIGSAVYRLFNPVDEEGEVKPISKFTDLLEAIKQFPEKLITGFIELIDKLATAIINFPGEALGKISDYFHGIRVAMFGEKTKVEEVVEDPEKHPIVKALSTVGTVISKIVNTVLKVGIENFDTVIRLAKRVLMLAGIFYGVRMIKGASDTVTSISSFFKNVGGMTKHIQEIIGASKWKILSSAILDMAKAIALVAGSIYVISTVPEDDLTKGLGVMILIASVLSGMYALKAYLDDKFGSGDEEGIPSLENFSEFLGSFAKAIKDGIGEIVKAAKDFLSKSGKAVLIIGVVISILGMIKALIDVGGMSPGSIVFGLMEIISIFLTLVLLTHAMLKYSALGEVGLKQAISIIILLNGIILLMKGFIKITKILETVQFMTLLAGIGKTATVVVALSVLTAFLVGFTKSVDMAKVGKDLLKLSGSLLLLTLVVGIIGSFEVGTIAQAIASMTLLTILLAILTKVSANLPEMGIQNVIKMAGAIVLLSTSLWVFSAAIGNMVSVAGEVEKHWVAMAAMIGTFVVLIGALAAISKVAPEIGPIMLMLAGSVTFVGLAFYLVGEGVKAAVDAVVKFAKNIDVITQAIRSKSGDVVEAIAIIITGLIAGIGRGIAMLAGMFVEGLWSILVRFNEHAAEAGEILASIIVQLILGAISGIFKGVFKWVSGFFQESEDELTKEAKNMGKKTKKAYDDGVDEESKKQKGTKKLTIEAKEALSQGGNEVIGEAKILGRETGKAVDSELNEGEYSGDKTGGKYKDALYNQIQAAKEQSAKETTEIANTVDQNTQVADTVRGNTDDAVDAMAGEFYNQENIDTVNDSLHYYGENLDYGSVYKDFPGISADAGKTGANNFMGKFSEVVSGYGLDTGEGINDDLSQGLDIYSYLPIGSAQGTADSVKGIFNIPGLEDVSGGNMAYVTNGILGNSKQVTDAAGTVANDGASEMGNHREEWESTASYLVDGAALAVISNDSLRIAAHNMMISTMNAMRTAADERSPSKKTYKIGVDFVMGFFNSLRDKRKEAGKNGSSLMQLFLDSLKESLQEASNFVDETDIFNPVITPIVDQRSALNSIGSLRNVLNGVSRSNIDIMPTVGKVDIGSAVGELGNLTSRGNADVLMELKRNTEATNKLIRVLENQKLYLDGDTLVGKTVSRIDEALASRAILAGRRSR